MDHTYQNPLQMPACYAVLSEEEMTYEGGGFSIEITQEQAIQFAANVLVNTIAVLGRASFNYVTNTMKNGLADGLSVVGVVDHFWNRLNPWSKAITVGMVGIGTYYFGVQVYGMVRNVMSLVGSIKDAIDSANAEQQAAAQPALAA